MIDTPLDLLVRRDTFAEALMAMTTGQVMVAYLRCCGMLDHQIGAFFGTTDRAVSYAARRARDNVVEDVPELRVFLQGRNRRLGWRRR